MNDPSELLDYITQVEGLLPSGFEVAPEDGDLAYIRSARIARRIVEDAAVGQTGYFEVFFGHVETSLKTATPAVRDLIIVGLLEDIQNAILNDGGSIDVWLERLEPHTREAWDMVESMWSGRVSPRQFNRFANGGES